ncbi:MAG: FAD-dependent oxidoreductase [Deltaproteobacteria bacterium]|nr:FAD-dependent oxidoreductase [Deltaproteobacteria bacterium]
MTNAVIIGGGVVGLGIALALREAGLEVLVLEKSIVGGEASDAAAGMLAPRLENLARDPVFELGEHSLARYPDWVRHIEDASGLSVDFAVNGAVEMFDDAEALAARRTALQAQPRAASASDVSAASDASDASRASQVSGGSWVELDAAGLREHVPSVSSRFIGGYLHRAEAQVDPRRLVRALHRASLRAGVLIHEGALVHRIVHAKGQVEAVELVDQKVRTDIVVLAAGAWSSQIFGSELHKSKVKPVRGQMVVLRPRRAPSRPFIAAGGRYLVSRRDGRVLVGATMEECGFNKSTTAEGVSGLLSWALDTVPALAEASFVESWAGLRPATPDHRPLIGTTGVGGLFVATGHHRNGVLHAPATAEFIRDLILERTPPLDLTAFNPKR